MAAAEEKKEEEVVVRRCIGRGGRGVGEGDVGGRGGVGSRTGRKGEEGRQRARKRAIDSNVGDILRRRDREQR